MILPDYVECEDGLESLGPLEGWAQEKEYHPTWLSVGGLADDDRYQYPSKSVASRCVADMPLYIFWDKHNNRNLNAVGVYLWDQRRDIIDSENLLGYLPDHIATNCVKDYLGEDKRFIAVIRKIFTSETGNLDVYLEIVSFANVARRKKLQRDQRTAASPG